jgi:hypothetical protein
MPAPVVINGQSPHRPAAQPAEYVDVQKGYPLVCVLAVTSLTTLGFSWIVGAHLLASLILFAQLAVMVCFCTLLIRVKDGCLTWQFGPGWIRGKVALSAVVTTHIVMSPFAYGWGFRRTGQGWCFDRKGAPAIEIHCRGGKRLRLGTSRAHELQHFLENARERRHRL